MHLAFGQGWGTCVCMGGAARSRMQQTQQCGPFWRRWCGGPKPTCTSASFLHPQHCCCECHHQRNNNICMCCSLRLKQRYALCTHHKKLRRPPSKPVCMPSLFVRAALGLLGLWNLALEQRRANFVALHVWVIANSEWQTIQTSCAAPPHQSTAQAQ